MRFIVALTLAMGAGFAPAADAQDAYTTRIETRPYYGAVVTIENGVRVYRPVPPTTHLIINPDGLTPLAIGINSGAIVRTAPPQASNR